MWNPTSCKSGEKWGTPGSGNGHPVEGGCPEARTLSRTLYWCHGEIGRIEIEIEDGGGCLVAHQLPGAGLQRHY